MKEYSLIKELKRNDRVKGCKRIAVAIFSAREEKRYLKVLGLAAALSGERFLPPLFGSTAALNVYLGRCKPCISFGFTASSCRSFIGCARL